MKLAYLKTDRRTTPRFCKVLPVSSVQSHRSLLFSLYTKTETTLSSLTFFSQFTAFVLYFKEQPLSPVFPRESNSPKPLKRTSA